MNRTFFTLLKNASAAIVLFVMVVGPFQPLIAHAQLTPSFSPTNLGTVPTGASFESTGAGLSDNGLTAQNTGLSVGGSTATPATAAATAAQQTSAGTQQGGSLPTSNCALAKDGKISSGGDWAQCVTDIIYVFTIGIGTGFAYVAAYFFDWAVALSLNGTAYALNFIAEGWTTARDIGNMAFLFILLYIAFKIMFEAETSDTVHMLVVVIVVALLVNFSFFFTRLVIDAGNILAIQFYNAIDVPSVATTANGSGVQSGAASTITNGIGYAGTSGTLNSGTTAFSNSKDLTYGIMGMLNLQGLLGTDSYKKWREGPTYGFLSALITLSFLYIAAGIMLWILTVAFITNGIKFLFRIVILWFLIIASPLAFIAYAIPKFKGYYEQWQNALIQHAFYPVVFMFIFLILTNFAKQMSGNNALINGIFNGLTNSNAGSASAVSSIGYAVANVGIRMGFVIAMLYIGMEASKKIGIMGADMANHAGNWVGGKFKGTMVAGAKYGPGWAAGAAYRRTGGAIANRLDTTLKNSRWANRTDATWANPLGKLGGVVGYRMRRNVLAPMKETSLGTVASTYTEREKFLKERKGEMQSNTRDAENKAILTKVAANPAGATDEEKDRIKNMGKRELESLKADDLKKVAAVLTDDQIKRIADMEKLNDKEKDDIRREWEENSTSAPFKKANKIVNDQLQDIHTQLTTGGVTATTINISAGTTVNETVIKAAQAEVKVKLAEEKDKANDRARYTPAQRKQAQINVANLSEAQSHLKELDEQRKKIRPDSKGVINTHVAGEFKVI